MLALLVHCHANGISSSRRIERATYRAAHPGRQARPRRPPSERQGNLTGPDSAQMRRSDAHGHPQGLRCLGRGLRRGRPVILATSLVATSAGAPGLAAAILGLQATLGLPRTVLADTGYASGKALARLQALGIEPLVAIGRTRTQRPHGPHGFRPQRHPGRHAGLPSHGA